MSKRNQHMAALGIVAAAAGMLPHAGRGQAPEPRPVSDWMWAEYYDPNRKRGRDRNKPPFNRERENARRRRQGAR